ncbi:Similar to hypothetical protein SCHCODRAFT_232403 [Schizophyllum commune H4-8]; acc. no. XP_003035858 [Pyronema omphalodes CBS 100304]|uniref:Wax synthase domain-containing protein n=1 Tax=Pyronema omphalodes (strain CBS 100304) TaxID=1076935 RepID=U4LW69_PYROM|nr:Similar to hypothetical protein SCHCODRAFT_232403 [Schizophyllum commune H4-8]; acc. no. XP_003035858 [Pyronema omphalodes CBS 100304]
MLTRVAFTPFPHIFLFLSLLYGHRLHPRLRFLLFLPQLLLHISVLLLIPATNPQNDYIFGVVTFFVLINTSSLFLFTPDPWCLRRLTSPPFTSLSTWNRIKWAGELATISRGIGWNFQITPIFPTLGTTKRSFLLGVVKRILMLQAIYEVSLWYLSTVGNTPGVTEDLLQRVKTSAAMMAWSWHSIEFPYLLFILLCIFTGLLFLDPRESPQMFGQITQIYSVRRFWGRGWHQGLRRMFQVHGRWVAGKLGAKKGGKVAGYIQVWVAFAISGVGHAWGFMRWIIGGVGVDGGVLFGTGGRDNVRRCGD